MTCAEFQKSLPYIIDGGGTPEEKEHLQGCSICSELVSDLTYIAQQAKLLVPMVEPAEKVWTGIKETLKKEGRVKNASSPESLLGAISRSRWKPASWMLPLGALVLIAIGLFWYHDQLSRNNQQQAAAALPTMQSEPAAMGAPDDQEIISMVGDSVPSARPIYEENLRHVNTYIADAQSEIATSPNDDDARLALTEAYQQKAMLYHMAVQDSLR